ncbi:MAG: MFS transporter [Massilia sp.]
MDQATTPRQALLRDANFRWLIGGGAISMLGDQFTMIALPWLVLMLTHDPLALGLVIALMSIPRALLILVGGALVDRSSPQTVLQMSKLVNALLLFALAAMVLSGHASMMAVYLLAFALGLASAFGIPAGTAILPAVVAPAQLPLANGMLMGMRQISLLAGPLLAALVFALFGDGSDGSAHAARGIGIAFALDCLSFLVSYWTLSMVRLQHLPPAAAPEAMFSAIGAGIATVWRDVHLRVCMLYWALCAFVVGGTMQVAMPLLASNRLGGATALGVLMGMHGVGSLAGMALSGVAGKFRLRTFGLTLLAIDAIAGVLLMVMGAVHATWQAVLVMLIIGVLGGFMQVAVFSWIQQRVPRAMLGRAMSIFMFIFMGVAPLAAAITGWLLTYVNLTELFVGAGGFLVCAVIAALLFTPMAQVSDAPAAE